MKPMGRDVQWNPGPVVRRGGARNQVTGFFWDPGEVRRKDEKYQNLVDSNWGKGGCRHGGRVLLAYLGEWLLMLPPNEKKKKGKKSSSDGRKVRQRRSLSTKNGG